LKVTPIRFCFIQTTRQLSTTRPFAVTS
jgi:hypothetical protein